MKKAFPPLPSTHHSLPHSLSPFPHRTSSPYRAHRRALWETGRGGARWGGAKIPWCVLHTASRRRLATCPLANWSLEDITSLATASHCPISAVQRAAPTKASSLTAPSNLFRLASLLSHSPYLDAADPPLTSHVAHLI
ncbi:hypothetical protein Aperf_G00000110249 [Anoplocephala perfoliata]